MAKLHLSQQLEAATTPDGRVCPSFQSPPVSITNQLNEMAGPNFPQCLKCCRWLAPWSLGTGLDRRCPMQSRPSYRPVVYSFFIQLLFGWLIGNHVCCNTAKPNDNFGIDLHISLLILQWLILVLCQAMGARIDFEEMFFSEVLLTCLIWTQQYGFPSLSRSTTMQVAR